MSAEPYFPASYTRGAALLRRLQALRPGEVYRMDLTELIQVEVPASILDRQTPEFIARWMHARMPFYCTVHHGVMTGWWEIERPAVAISNGDHQ